MKIQFADLRSQYEQLKPEIDTAILGVMEKSDYILGGHVAGFEKKFAAFTKTKYCVSCDNGTNALTMAIRALKLPEGSEIIIPANTFIADALSIHAAGHKIKLCDVDADTQLMTVETVKRVITKNTNAIIPVSLFGQMVGYDVIHLAESHGLKIILDNCQAHGAASPYSDKGYTACYSFYPAKNLGCAGDGGAICTNDEETYKELLLLRNYGSTRKYFHDIIGYNARMDTLQAAILNVKLPHLQEWNMNRTEMALEYEGGLSDLKEIKLPKTIDGNLHVHHLYVIQTERRNELMEYLNAKQIGCGIHYPIPIHKQQAFHLYEFGSGNSFPVTESLSGKILSLAMHPFLTLDEIAFVCDTIKEFFA